MTIKRASDTELDRLNGRAAVRELRPSAWATRQRRLRRIKLAAAVAVCAAAVGIMVWAAVNR